MKFGIFKYKESTNLGDEIQSIAAKQFLPRIDKYVDRDYLHTYNGADLKVIMNGWFMEKPFNWPPSKEIKPLFISFHASKSQNADKEIVSIKHRDYYRLHEPIGCRDHKTVSLFKKIGVKAYYSGCLTLTLNKRSVEKTGKIIIVDPFRNNLPKILVDKYMDQFIPEKEKSNIEWIYQDNGEEDIEKRYELADKMLDAYAGAKLVITSRIHCALPCLAFGTPVLFLDSGFRTKQSRDRFNGITNLMNVIGEDVFPYPNTLLKKVIFNIFKPYARYNVKSKHGINFNDIPTNPIDTTDLVTELVNSVKKFIDE